MKRAFITGITGQDGAYLAQLLLNKGYRVYGTHRANHPLNSWRLDELGIRNHECLQLLQQDHGSLPGCIQLIERTQPDEVYNLAAQSIVGASFGQPVATAQMTGMGALYLLEAVRVVNSSIRYYQASSAEMYGRVQTAPQTEETPFSPKSPYGVVKLFAHWMTQSYRDCYQVFACSGILFNHESPLRGPEFVTRKVTEAAAKIKLNQLDTLILGNLDAKRDWGYAKEYVEGMWRMLQVAKPDTYVLATQRSETVREFVRLAFQAVGIELAFEGQGLNEIARDVATGKVRVSVSPQFYSPTEVDILLGCADKAKQILGWEAKTNLETLSQMMVEADLQRLTQRVGTL